MLVRSDLEVQNEVAIFAGPEALGEMRFTAWLGYAEGEMSRRLELVNQRATRMSR